MIEQKKTEAEQKDIIFDIFSKCHNEPVSSRHKKYYKGLCKEIYKWCGDYLSINVKGRGFEIAIVIDRFLKDEIIPKIPKDKDGFFKYLIASVCREKTVFSQEYDKKDTIKVPNEEIKIPKDKKWKLRQVEDYIIMMESNLGRSSTPDERQQGISKWFKKKEYIDLLNVIGVSGNDRLDKEPSLYDTPHDQYIKKTNKEIVFEIVKSLLDNKQERSRDCHRALFTLHCIENYKDFEALYPVLDDKMLEAWQTDGKKPKQYEIYQNYHPNAQKSSADAMASKNLNEFLADIETQIKERNP